MANEPAGRDRSEGGLLDGIFGAVVGDEELPLLLTVVAGLIALLLLSPLAWLVLRVGDVGGERALSLLTGPSTLDVLVWSVGLVVAVTAFAAAIGVPLAVLTVQSDLPFRRFFTITAALPLVVPSYIGAFAFVSAFGPSGALATALAPLGVERLPSIYGFEGAVLVLTLFTYPYIYLSARASLLSFDGTLVEAARTLNHDRWSAFRRVVLPQILPGIAAGALLVALYTLADFGTPTIMRVDVFTSMIYTEYNIGNTGYAALLSFQLLAVTLVFLWIENRTGGADTRTAVSGSKARSGRITLGPWRWVAVLFPLTVAALALAVPVGILLMWLARPTASYGGGSPFTVGIVWNSVSTAAAAAAVSVLVAVPVGYLAARYRSRVTTLIDRATYVGYAVPGIVLGLALVFLGRRFVPSLYLTVPLLVFAYVVRFAPQAVGTVRSSVLQVDDRLTEASRSLGHSRLSTFRRVVLPLIAPGVSAGAALVFLTTMKELPATLLLRPFGFNTIVTYIWDVQEGGYYGRAAVPALVLVCISGLSMLVILARERYDGT